MERFKKCLKGLAMPQPVLATLLVLTGFGLLIYGFVFDPENETLAYVSYGLSAWALVVLCFGVPRVIHWSRGFKERNTFLRRYLAEPQYRVKLSLYSSLSINLLYVVLQLGNGLYHHSAWFYTLAGYHGILAVMRCFLLKETLKARVGEDLFVEYLHYRLCGVLFLLMNLALGAMVAYIVWQDRGIQHHPIVTIAMAAYTFTATTMAVINVFRYRKYKSPVLASAKIISFASALVSMLSLETAMLTAFGQGEDPAFRKTMTAITGGVVCAIILAMAVYMTVYGTIEINKLKGEKENARTRKG